MFTIRKTTEGFHWSVKEVELLNYSSIGEMKRDFTSDEIARLFFWGNCVKEHVESDYSQCVAPRRGWEDYELTTWYELWLERIKGDPVIGGKGAMVNVAKEDVRSFFDLSNFKYFIERGWCVRRDTTMDDPQKVEHWTYILRNIWVPKKDLD